MNDDVRKSKGSERERGDYDGVDAGRLRDGIADGRLLLGFGTEEATEETTHGSRSIE